MNDKLPTNTSTRAGKSDGDWRKELTPEQYEVLRKKGTEPPFTGSYVFEKRDGTYRCAACGSALFSSDAKFDSASGWPSFTEPADRANVELREDSSHGLLRTEVRCASCGGHLGHVFADGPGESGERFCINSCSLALDDR
jgi:peptide-methionine (R)-S-oxide reductase